MAEHEPSSGNGRRAGVTVGRGEDLCAAARLDQRKACEGRSNVARVRVAGATGDVERQAAARAAGARKTVHSAGRASEPADRLRAVGYVEDAAVGLHVGRRRDGVVGERHEPVCEHDRGAGVGLLRGESEASVGAASLDHPATARHHAAVVGSNVILQRQHGAAEIDVATTRGAAGDRSQRGRGARELERGPGRVRHHHAAQAARAGVAELYRAGVDGERA